MALLKMMAFCPRLCLPMKAWQGRLEAWQGRLEAKAGPWSLRVGAAPPSVCAPLSRTGPIEMEIPVARRARQAPSSKPWVPRESSTHDSIVGRTIGPQSL